MSRTFNHVLDDMNISLSASTLTAAANANTSTVTTTVSNSNGGTLTYSWQQSGTSCTINTSTASSTTFTGIGTAAGSTTVFCNITNSVTGVTTSSPTCIITWTAVAVSQNVVISGTPTYNNTAQTYTLTGTPASPAPTGTPTTFTNAGTYVYPTNITSITPGSGYTLGTVSGSFVINKKALTAFTAPSYYFDPYASFWVVQVITISGGIANSPFDGMTISAFTNTSSPDLPVTLSGVFDGAGNFTYTFPNGGAVLFQNIGGQDGFIRLTTALSLNYTGTFTARLRPLG